MAGDGFRWPPLLGALVVSLCLNASARAQIAAQPGLDELTDGISFPTSRQAVQQLEQARSLLEKEDYVEAIRYLGSILGGQEDYFFQPDAERAIHRSLKSEAERLVGQMPKQGRENYQLQYGAIARQALSEAAAAADILALADISRRYFHTQSGYEATLLLGLHHYDHGRPLAAALCFERLLAVPDVAVQWEPQLSLQLAACLAQAGRTDPAAELLVDLKRRHANAPVTLGGKQIAWFTDPSEAVPWLQEHVALAGGLPRIETEWTMYRGSPARTAISSGSTPLLNPRWKVRTTNDPATEKLINQLEQAYREQNITALPAGHPLVVGSTVLVRTADNLLAVDFPTGKRLWEVPVDDSLDALLESKGGEQNRGNTQVTTGLDQRVWEDSTFGMLSSDGRYVFSIEDLGFSLSGPQTRLIVTPDGRRRPDTSLPTNTNRLTAHDVVTGKLKWEIGGPEEEFSLPLAGTFFLGVPLPVSGQLYCLAEIEGEIRLVCLDARTGAEQWSQQLALLEQTIQQDPSRRVSGLSPSYADGVLVCPTAAGAVVAVDLTTRSLLWGYRYGATDTMNSAARMRMLQRGRVVTGQAGLDRWADSSVTIAGGKALLSPPESDLLHCLDLVTGELLWKIPREDGLYVAGVVDENVLIVGSQRLAMYQLSDGAAVWQSNQGKLPTESVPTGRGFLSVDKYYLPLSTAEVAAFDLSTGKIVNQTASRDGTIPGNLVCYRGGVIAQGPSSVQSFFQLESLEQQVATSLARNPEDALALAMRGEIRLHDNRLDEAIADLHSSLEIQNDPRARELLVEALVRGLEVDFASYRQRQAEIEQLLESDEQRSAYYRALADGLNAAGEIEAAFATYMRFTENQGSHERLEQIAPLLSVRRDRWVRNRLADLRTQATAEQVAHMDTAISERFEEAISAGTPQSLRTFLAYFGDHPLGNRARLELVAVLDPEAQALEQEALLAELQQSDDPAQRHEATARLALLMGQAARPADAAYYYQQLAGPLAEQVVLNGQTGKDLVEELAADSPIHRRMTAPQSWATGAVSKTTEERNSSGPRYFSFDVRGPRGPFFQDLTIEFDQNRRILVGRDGLGRDLWQTPLVDGSPAGAGLQYNVYVNHAQIAQHLLLITLGNELMAIDTLVQPANGGVGELPQARILWRQNLAESITGLHANNFIQVRQLRLPWGNRTLATASNLQPIGMLGHVGAGVVCFLRHRHLVAVDALTGKEVWVRRNVQASTQMWGDDEYLIVVGQDDIDAAEEADAVVIRLADGAEVAPCKVPALERRFATLGKSVVEWTSSDVSRVRLVDPTTGEQRWQHEFNAAAKGAMIDNQLLVVVEPSGRIALVDMNSGQLINEVQGAEDSNLSEVHAIRSGEQLIVFASHLVEDQQRGVFVNPLPLGVNNPNNPLVNGWIYAFDAESGKEQWRLEVAEQGVLLTQPSDVPVLVFAATVYKRNARNLGVNQTESHLLCVEKRTGRPLYRNVFSKPLSGYIMTGFPQDDRVVIDLQRTTLTFKFTDEPLETETPADVSNEAAEGTEDDEAAKKQSHHFPAAAQRQVVLTEQPAPAGGLTSAHVSARLALPARGNLDISEPQS